MGKRFVLFFSIFLFIFSQNIVFANEMIDGEEKYVDKVTHDEVVVHEKVTLMEEFVINNLFHQLYVNEKGEEVVNLISIPIDYVPFIENAENPVLEAKKYLMFDATKFQMENKLKELKHQYANYFQAKEFEVHPDIKPVIEKEEYEALSFVEQEMEKWMQKDEKEREKEIQELKETWSHYWDYEDESGGNYEHYPDVNGVPYSFYQHLTDEELKMLGAYDVMQIIKKKAEENKKTQNEKIENKDKNKEETEDKGEKEKSSISWMGIAFGIIVIVIIGIGVFLFIRKRR